MKQRSFQANFQTLWHSIVCLAPEHSRLIFACCWEYNAFAQHLIKHRGLPSAIRVLKEVHVVAKRVSMGIVHRDVSYKEMFMKTTSSGIPRALRKLHLLLTSRRMSLRRCALSVSASYLLMTTGPQENLSTVMSPYTGAPYKDFLHIPGYSGLTSGDSFVSEPTIMTRLLVRFVKWFVPRWLQPKLEPDNIHIFSGFRGGPYGTPSFRFAPRDAFTLLSKEYSWLLESCKQFALIYGGEAYLKQWLEQLIACAKYFEVLYDDSPFVPMSQRSHLKGDGRPKDFPKRVARFSFLSEKGGKTRIITSANYWIQLLLFPFHHNMMNLLGKISTDYAFDQEKSGEVLCQTLPLVRSAFSYDMTGATDRFPLWFQELCLNSLRPGLGTAWASIMRLPVYHTGRRRTFRFQVGQPMGIYSSWAVFSYCHHVLVRCSAWIVKLDPRSFSLYLLLGDDICILHRRVARCYHYLLTVVLGVGISDFKSVVFPSRASPGAEFAKRNYFGGIEVSPLSPSLLVSLITGKDPSLIQTLIIRVLSRWKLKVKSQSEFVCDLFKRCIPLRRRNCVMTWFLSPPVLPKSLVISERLFEIKDEWYPELLFDFGVFKHALSVHRLNLISMASRRVEHVTMLLRKLYSFPKGKLLMLTMSPFIASDGESVRPKVFSEGGFLPDAHRGKVITVRTPRVIPYHPLQAVMQQIKCRVMELKKVPGVDRDLYRILTLLKHYTSFFKGKVVRGRFYAEVRKTEVLTSYPLAKRVKGVSHEVRRKTGAWF